MDGLLFDSERVVQRAWNYAGELMGYPEFGNHIYHTIGFNRKRRGEYFREHVNPEFPMDWFTELTRKKYYQILEQEGIPKKPGVEELLQYAKESGIKRALATSSSRYHAEAMLGRYDLLRYFDGAVCGDMVTRGKPAPEIYIKAAQIIGLPCEYALALEDAPNGVRAAAAANMRVIMVPDLVEPDEEIQRIAWKRCDSLFDVLELLKRGA